LPQQHPFPVSAAEASLRFLLRFFAAASDSQFVFNSATFGSTSVQLTYKKCNAKAQKTKSPSINNNKQTNNEQQRTKEGRKEGRKERIG